MAGSFPDDFTGRENGFARASRMTRLRAGGERSRPIHEPPVHASGPFLAGATNLELCQGNYSAVNK
jgi:hypothetical protein